MTTIDLPQGRLHYTDTGSGPPVVLLHGLFVNGTLWRDVVPLLSGGHRVIVPDLPMGAHPTPFPATSDITPKGVARIVADLLAALDLTDVTLVGNDTGGAIAQLVAAWHPERLGRLVLTPCDAYENFLPPAFRYLQLSARVPGLTSALMQSMRFKPLRRTPTAFGWLAKRLPDDVLDGWMQPAMHEPGLRTDAARFLRGIDSRDTVEAATRLRSFGKPLVIGWAPEDRFFKYRYAERLAREIPGARLERIEDSLTFVCLDQPERTAELIAGAVAAG